MKRINYKKRAVIHGLSMAVFLGACLGLQANDQEKGVSANATVNTDRSASSSTDHSSDRSYTATSDRNINNDGKLSRADSSFIKEAAQGGLMEVKMGQTAKDRASSADVKSYGEMLVKDHSKANDKLSSLAAQKGVNLAKDTENKHDRVMKDLEGKSGNDFDRAFIQDAIKDHRKDISKFEKASRDLTDSDLRSFAMESLPTLRNHLSEAERIAKSLGVDVTVRNLDNTDAAVAAAASSAGAPGLNTTEANSSVNRVDVDVNRNQGADANVDIKTDASKDNQSSYSTSSSSSPHKTLGITTEKGDGKTLGLNTRKDDGKLLGIFPAPGRHKADKNVDVDVDKTDHSVAVTTDADRDRDASIGAPPSSEKGASANADVNVDHTKGDKNVKSLAYSELPQKVQDTIKAQGGSTDAKARKTTKDGKTVYRVSIPKEGRNHNLQIAEDGTIIKDNNK